MKPLSLIAYIGSIILANALVVTVGLIPVGFGLYAPAGVLAVGLTLSLRDAVQDRYGRRVAFGAVIVGCAISALFAGPFALASFVAFLLSETLDMLAYTPLRERGHLIAAIFVSNTIGLVVDSIAFLWLAFGSLEFLAGQIVGKMEVTIVVVAIVWLVQRSQRRYVAA